MNITKPQKLIYDMEKFAGGAIAVICGSMLVHGKKDLSEIKRAVNELYRLNDALRICIRETDGEVVQTVAEYTEQEIKVLCFDNKAELDAYAEDYAKTPLDFYGDLCEINIVTLPEQYGLLIKLHHIIGDAWTLSLLGTQFNKLINVEDVEAYSYADYVESENTYIQSKRYEKDKSYFFEQFKKCDEVTYLSEKQTDTFNACRKTFVIDKEQTMLINTYAQQKGTSTFMLFVAALSTYMNRVKMNTEKFYIGTAVLNRSGVKENNTVGMFVNTAPMLIELDNSKSFAENLSAIEDTAFSVFRHQKYNYGDILATIRKEFNFSEKLYDVMISYQNATVTGADIETTWYHCDSQSESLQIHIDDRDNEGIFRIHYDYQADKFTENEIERLHQHICNLLFDAIGDDSKKLYELNILSADEKLKLLYDFNDTAVDYPRDKCVHQLFEEQVKINPNKTAVIFKDVALSYSELQVFAQDYGNKLVQLGAKENDVVAIHLERSHKLIAFQLAVLKIGAVFLPVDKRYPIDRIEYMYNDCNVNMLISDELNKDDLNANFIGISEFETIATTTATQTVNNSDVCYIIYTSGSTGTPKGCMLTGKGLVNFCKNNNTLETLDKLDNCVFACVNSVSFDYFIAESLLPLTNGFTTVILDDNESTIQGQFLDVVDKNNINVVMTTPTRLKMYFDDKFSCDELKQLECICTSGEPLTPELLTQMYDKSPNAQVYNPIGPSECSVWDIGGKLERADGIDIHIGKPIANARIYIVDKFMHITPIGVTGELCIAGDGVGAGYLNRPELTAKKFIDNPFGEGKLYKTGDLAYWREDGNIVYVGRNDFQVKIRGLRIELGEIENAICGTPGISQAVVVVRKNEEGRQLICAFYTGVQTDVKHIRTNIGKKLPQYMLPHICTYLEDMPLTSSGKINRKALPEVNLYVVDNTVEYVAPTTEQEKTLVATIEIVLGASKVGVMDNFFDIGGDSLKAIELIAKLENHGYHTDTKTIFECVTIQQLAECLTATENIQDVFDYSRDIPATDAQMRVYTAQSMESDSTTYNVPYIFKVDEVDVDHLQIAINRLIDRHEILRTHFENKDGNIIQVINETVECRVELLDNDNITTFVRPFDLSKLPLLRIGIYENTVMIDMHHIITDGGSMPVFLNELNELYMGRRLDNTPVQYKQFAVQKQDHSESEKYWLSVYGDEVPVLEINTDYHRSQKQSFNGSAIYDAIEINLHNKILAFCKEQNITPYVFYMSGFSILLSKFSGNEDIVVGMPISGRDSKYLETIGMFVNTIALRNKPIGTKKVSEFLQEVKENSINAINHQDYPYGELVKKLDIHIPDRNPLFDVMFAYQSEQMTDVVFGDKQAELLPVPITTSKYDFTFNVMPRDNGVVIMAEYCTDLYKEHTIQRFIDGYKRILEQLLNSNNLLKDISAIAEAENQMMIYGFNDTTVDYPRDKCVHQLFEEQVAKIPNKVAVIADDKTLTYAELNEEANKIAHSLIEKVVGIDDIVAIKLTRKSYLFSSMIGVLKTGAAYMPIDPTYPEDRINYMLTESKAKYCIDEDNVLELLTSENINNLDIAINHNDAFCALHTSGSTGKPKMSLLKHGGMMNFITANQRFWQDTDTIVSATIVTFDAFVMDSVLSVAQGKQVVLASEDEIYNQTLFEKLFDHSEHNMFFSTPTKIENYIESSKDKTYLSRIKSFVVGGEVFAEHLLDLIKGVSHEGNVYNIYGPTETTICAMVDEIVVGKEITIGTPIANTQIYIVNQYMQPTPIGVTGELCIAGDGVGAGYLNRPELTAEKFIDNPFGEGKLYKTGDLAYWREDGNIIYVGRNDFQVKIRGLRIELEEIENAICGIEGISQAVVVVRKNEEGRQLICAFYSGAETDAKEIRNHIGKKLPKYMLPHICTHLDEMPMTTSGKIDRKALPEIDLENIANDTEYVAPETQMQKELCKLIELVLGTTPVGITDDFFDLGGDSLKAIEFVSKAHNEGIYFNLQNVFDYPTVKEMCECIENGDKQVISFADVDFTEVNKVLEKNKLDYIFAPQKTDVGNILLAGATGYLGIHILADYLDNDFGTAYCLVRGNDKADSTKRLQELLNFYFGDKYAGMHRVEVVCADLQKDKFGLPDAEYVELMDTVDTVINCAASVKHYGSYKYFYEANVETTKRLIEFCIASNAKLIHTSTLSVSGNTFGDAFDGYISETEKLFYESSLYIEQPLENVYGRSKFEAEKAVLDAMCEGLKANIMRMGNLTNRISDGQFQKNHESNAFLQRVKGVLEIGIFPDYLIKDTNYAEFTPIDEAANAVMTIARHFSTEQTVFHINSIKVVYFDKLVEIINQLGYDLKLVSGTVFTEALRQTAKQTGMEHIFETFINDMDENDQLNYDSNIRIENDFTVQYLKVLGFEWSNVGIDYLRKYVEYFRKIGYFR